jgi:hypothetical protein
VRQPKREDFECKNTTNPELRRKETSMTAEQIVRNIMRAMYPKTGAGETPEQVILLNALRLHGLDAQVRNWVRASGERPKPKSKPTPN